MLYFILVGSQGKWHYTHETRLLAAAVEIARAHLLAGADRCQIIQAETIDQMEECQPYFADRKNGVAGHEQKEPEQPARARKKKSEPR